MKKHIMLMIFFGLFLLCLIVGSVISSLSIYIIDLYLTPWHSNLVGDGTDVCPENRITTKCQNLTEDEWEEECERNGCYTSHTDNNNGIPTICLPVDHTLASQGGGGTYFNKGPMCTGGTGQWFSTLVGDGNDACPSTRITTKCQNLTEDDWEENGCINGCYSSHVDNNDGNPTICLPNNHSLASQGDAGTYFNKGPMCSGGIGQWFSNLVGDDGNVACPENKRTEKCQNLTQERFNEICEPNGCYSSHVDNNNGRPTLCLENNHTLTISEGLDIGIGPECAGGEGFWYSDLVGNGVDACPTGFGTTRLTQKCETYTKDQWLGECGINGCYTSHVDNNNGRPTICLPVNHTLASQGHGATEIGRGPECTGGDGQWFSSLVGGGTDVCPENRITTKCQNLTQEQWDSFCEPNGCYTSHVDNNDGRPTICLPKNHSLASTGDGGTYFNKGPECTEGDGQWFSNFAGDGSDVCLGTKHPYKCQNLSEGEWNAYCAPNGCYSYHPDNPGFFTQCLPNNHSKTTGRGSHGSGAGTECLNPEGASIWDNFNCFDSEITGVKCQEITGNPENDYEGIQKQNYHSTNDESRCYCVPNGCDGAAHGTVVDGVTCDLRGEGYPGAGGWTSTYIKCSQ